jgi:hypothetical protein
MDIDTRAEFAADPNQVFTLLTDKAFLDAVCSKTHARSHEVSVEGSTVKTSRQLPAPDAARPFTGDTLTVVEEIVWGEPQADGSRTGTATMKVPGQPVNFTGRYVLAPGGTGSSLTLTGQLKVNVPLLGKKLEQAAAPAVMAGFRTQEQVGAEWLAG